MGKRIITILITASLILTSWAVPFTNRVDLHGGQFSTKSMSLWELEKYKYTELLRKTPLCYAPFKAYTIIDGHVKIENRNNRNWLVIDTDIIAQIKDDSDYNRKHAKRYKGNAKERVRQIYRYCQRTEYVAHVKTARDVFEKRQGDCAGIASAFYVMCKKNHVPVRYVIGWTKEGCHAWNRVKIKGHWYWIDPTLGYWFSIKQFKGRTVMEMW